MCQISGGKEAFASKCDENVINLNACLFNVINFLKYPFFTVFVHFQAFYLDSRSTSQDHYYY